MLSNVTTFVIAAGFVATAVAQKAVFVKSPVTLLPPKLKSEAPSAIIKSSHVIAVAESGTVTEPVGLYVAPAWQTDEKSFQHADFPVDPQQDAVLTTVFNVTSFKYFAPHVYEAALKAAAFAVGKMALAP